MSREDKKQRVMVLFETELEEAQMSSEATVEALLDENEVLHSMLRAKSSASSASSRACKPPRQSSSAAGLLQLAEKEEEEAPQKTSSRGISQGIAFLAAIIVVLGSVGWWFRSTRIHKDIVSTSSKEVQASLVTTASRGAWRSFQGFATVAPVPSPAGPPDVAAAAQRLRERGMQRLAQSDCMQASWFFESAFKMLQEQTGHATLTEMARLQGDRGFALVCAQRFVEGAGFLEQHLQSFQSNVSAPTHFLNALGYARFRMQEYDLASDAFEAGTRADPLNPILWNNLAAAKLVRGDIQAADDALYHAWDQAEGKTTDKAKGSEHYLVDEFQRQLISGNIQRLACQNYGADRRKLECPEVAGVPVVDLWIP